MVASIGGEWRYVDCISAHAGKGRAMAYLASKFQVGQGRRTHARACLPATSVLSLSLLPRSPAPCRHRPQIALEDVVAAGDSGNDLLMLGRVPGQSGGGFHPAIVMANSHPEVRWRQYARRRQRDMRHTGMTQPNLQVAPGSADPLN